MRKEQIRAALQQDDRSLGILLLVWLHRALLVIVMMLTHNLIVSPTGRAMLAMKNSTAAAQAMGISLMKYIRQKRLLMARHLLEKGERPLSIYSKCGFSDYTTFYKAYVKYFGKAPSEDK